ncbi:MAG TPA: energy transducer TonB [Acidobacteriaceae bacterium]|jgi:TonB family protein|nr:energy transducer TonB [Acidobacteriaceae bacterium]
MIDDDAKLEQALLRAFTREPAPDTLLARFDQKIAASARGLTDLSSPTPALRPSGPEFIPTFAGLQITTQSRWTSILSFGTHLLLASLIVLLALGRWHERQIQRKLLATTIDVTPFVPASPLKDIMGGGGGGGNHDIIEASKGKLPKFAKTQIAPPQILRIDHPKLAVEPTVVMPPIKLPDATNMPDLGIPQSPQVAFASQGSGSGSGFGSGSGGGVGSGRGNGIGPGEGGGYGGGVYHVGGGVSNPTLIYAPDPEFSDEARRAKYQGVCVVGLIVDAQGNPQRVHIVRPLGMGLDEKAMEAVKQYKFKPAIFKGKPVPVEVDIEVNFRIY